MPFQSNDGTPRGPVGLVHAGASQRRGDGSAVVAAGRLGGSRRDLGCRIVWGRSTNGPCTRALFERSVWFHCTEDSFERHVQAKRGCDPPKRVAHRQRLPHKICWLTMVAGPCYSKKCATTLSPPGDVAPAVRRRNGGHGRGKKGVCEVGSISTQIRHRSGSTLFRTMYGSAIRISIRLQLIGHEPSAAGQCSAPSRCTQSHTHNIRLGVTHIHPAARGQTCAKCNFRTHTWHDYPAEHSSTGCDKIVLWAFRSDELATVRTSCPSSL